MPSELISEKFSSKCVPERREMAHEKQLTLSVKSAVLMDTGTRDTIHFHSNVTFVQSFLIQV